MHDPAPRQVIHGSGDVTFTGGTYLRCTTLPRDKSFTGLFAALLKPAIEAAGFVARTAKRQGSDVIQSAIINELLEADLVLVDLTEHNPNVLFELGVRMARDRPVVLVKARGTGAIFDVDNMLRVESYNPNIWPSTVATDVPMLTQHVREAWQRRETNVSFMTVMGQAAE